MVEYAVMLALILLVFVAAARTLGCNLNTTFSNTAQSIGS
jgi:Flp pilus assembly pilin Flp